MLKVAIGSAMPQENVQHMHRTADNNQHSPCLTKKARFLGYSQSRLAYAYTTNVSASLKEAVHCEMSWEGALLVSETEALPRMKSRRPAATDPKNSAA